MVEEAKVEINVGTLRSVIGELNFRFVVDSQGESSVQLFAYDPTDRRKAGVFFTLNPSQYRDLKELISRVDSTIAKIEKTGQASFQP